MKIKVCVADLKQQPELLWGVGKGFAVVSEKVVERQLGS